MELVAERAGVSVRTLFRQFQGTEALRAALVERVGGAAFQMALDWTAQGSAAADLDALLDARVRMFVAVEPLKRLGRQVEPTRVERHDTFGMQRKMLRQNLFGMLRAHVPEPDPELLDALDAWISIDVWTRLREGRGLSKVRTARVMKRGAHALLAALEGARQAP